LRYFTADLDFKEMQEEAVQRMTFQATRRPNAASEMSAVVIAEI